MIANIVNSVIVFSQASASCDEGFANLELGHWIDSAATSSCHEVLKVFGNTGNEGTERYMHSMLPWNVYLLHLV